MSETLRVRPDHEARGFVGECPACSTSFSASMPRDVAAAVRVHAEYAHPGTPQ